VYGPELCSGSKFPRQIRDIRKTVETETDDAYLLPLEKLQPEWNKYFVERFWSEDNNLCDIFGNHKRIPFDVGAKKPKKDPSSEVETCSCCSCCDDDSQWNHEDELKTDNTRNHREEIWYKYFKGNKNHEKLRPLGINPWKNQVFSLRFEDISLLSQMEERSALRSQMQERDAIKRRTLSSISLDLGPQVQSNADLAELTEEETKQAETSKAIEDIIPKIEEQDRKLWSFQSTNRGATRGSTAFK